MSYFEFLVHEAFRLRREQDTELGKVAKELSQLYQADLAGQWVRAALQEVFFPLSLYVKHYLAGNTQRKDRVARAGQDLALLSQMYLRIRKDIDRYFDNCKVTCIDLNGNAFQEVPSNQWCSFCGECCQLTGTIPDPPEAIRYPGYWYAYLAGDGPLIQNFCPFLFELPPQGIFFCAIHNVKPLTCLAYEKEDCQANHPGRALDEA